MVLVFIADDLGLWGCGAPDPLIETKQCAAGATPQSRTSAVQDGLLAQGTENKKCGGTPRFLCFI